MLGLLSLSRLMDTPLARVLTKRGQLRFLVARVCIIFANFLPQIAFNHHAEVNHSAILLIRNPYEAIIGHRNLDR